MPKFPFDPAAPVILLDVIVEGPARRHLVRMILDTGATFTMLAPEILIDIGLDPAQSADRRMITTASGVEHVTFCTVPVVRTLGVAQENVAVCAHSLPSNIPARGLLGLNFLRGYHLHLDFPQGLLELHP